MKKPIGRPGRKWKDNIKMDVTEIVDFVRIWTGFIWFKRGTKSGLLWIL